MSELVSVVIATKDRADSLERAVRSVLEQTYPHLQVIVVDDGSPEPVSLALNDARVETVRLPRSRGAAAARNAGLDRARGELIALLDDDDTYLPHKIAVQRDYLRAHPGVDLVFSQVTVFEPDGSIGFRLPDDYRHDALENLRNFNAIHTNSALFRRRVADAVRFDERLTKFTDTQFFIAAALRFESRYLPVEVAVWNRDGRADQITRADPAKDVRNMRLLCEIFAEPLSRHPDIAARWRDELDDLERQGLAPRA